MGATLFPSGSEAVLFAVLKSHPDALWWAVGIATVGNTVGGMISFGMGWWLPQGQTIKHIAKVRQYGAPILCLAWLPLMGDVLCLAAGWLRLSVWQSCIWMGLGKLSRYLVVALITQHV